MRASEKITSDDIFLDLLSSDSLAVLSSSNDNDKLWGNVTFIESSPGGGKTTLLRMFSVEVLRRISSDKHREFKALINKLSVKERDKIKKCAVYVLMGRDYAYIDDEFENNNERRRVFLALLNARIIISTIKTIMNLFELSFSQIDKIVYNPDCDTSYFDGLSFPCKVSDLMEWVAQREKNICKTLDSYKHSQIVDFVDNSLISLDLMKPSYFSFKDKSLVDEFIFQLDDVHKLTNFQNLILKQEAVEHRIAHTLWIARRFEALSNSEMLSNTDVPERDYNVIRLDGEQSSIKYNPMFKKIAEKRSKFSLSGILLLPSLEDNLNDFEYEGAYKRATKLYLTRIQNEFNLNIYQKWIDWINSLELYRERAAYLRAFIIHYNREKGKGFENGLFPLDAEICQTQLDSLLSNAADLVCLENQIPYYYGMEKLLSLSTNNVEQFLHYAEHLYSYILTKHYMSPFKERLTAKEQNEIIVKVSKAKYSDIQKLPNGRRIHCFLEHLIRYSKELTYSPTFSYKFVSGFAIKQENSFDVPDCEWFLKREYEELATIIKCCVSYNLLEACPTRQGEPGQQWTVYYLNRWICAANGLSVSKGGWRKLGLRTLNNWLKKSDK